MTDQHDPVSPDEYVFRRIPKDKLRYDPSLSEPVTRLAFDPSKKDIDGISIFRALFVSAEDVAAAGLGMNGYCIARLLVRDIIALGLTVISDPRDDQLPGHSLIPELAFQRVNAKETKPKSKEYQRALAKLAGESIVFISE